MYVILRVSLLSPVLVFSLLCPSACKEGTFKCQIVSCHLQAITNKAISKHMIINICSLLPQSGPEHEMFAFHSITNTILKKASVGH